MLIVVCEVFPHTFSLRSNRSQSLLSTTIFQLKSSLKSSNFKEVLLDAVNPCKIINFQPFLLLN